MGESSASVGGGGGRQGRFERRVARGVFGGERTASARFGRVDREDRRAVGDARRRRGAARRRRARAGFRRRFRTFGGGGELRSGLDVCGTANGIFRTQRGGAGKRDGRAALSSDRRRSSRTLRPLVSRRWRRWRRTRSWSSLGAIFTNATTGNGSKRRSIFFRSFGAKSGPATPSIRRITRRLATRKRRSFGRREDVGRPEADASTSPNSLSCERRKS